MKRAKKKLKRKGSKSESGNEGSMDSARTCWIIRNIDAAVPRRMKRRQVWKNDCEEEAGERYKQGSAGARGGATDKSRYQDRTSRKTTL